MSACPPKRIVGPEIEKGFVRDGIAYSAIAAQVDEDGYIRGYSYEVTPRLLTLRELLLALRDFIFQAACASIVLVIIVCLLGVFLQ